MSKEEIIKKLEDISNSIEEFEDLTLHGEIRNKVENEDKTKFLTEEHNREYITTEIVLSRATEEIERAIESIKAIYTDKVILD